MLLVYFITSLPRLTFGEPPPVSRADFVAKARETLGGDDREELERLLLLDEIDETVRLMGRARAKDPGISGAELTSLLRTERRRAPEGPSVDELPDWVMMPLPQDVLYGRFFHMLRHKARSALLREYAAFTLDLESALAALVSEGEERPLKERLSDPEVLEGLPALDEGLRVELEPEWMGRVRAALKDDDFIEMERALDRLRWDTLEALKGDNPFSVDVVLRTYLQLRILEREASWDAARGAERLDALLRLPFDERLGDSTGASA